LTVDIDRGPMRGKFILTGEKLPYEPFRGYIDPFFDSAKSSGEYVKGEVSIAFKPGKEGDDLMTTVSGKLTGHNMALRFPDTDEPFVVADRLAVDLGTIRTDENIRFDMGEIAVTGAELKVLRARDGKLNLTRLWADQEEPDSRPADKQDGGETTVAIRAVTVDQSVVSIVDRSVSLEYSTRISSLSGNISALAPNAKRAELKLTAMGILPENSKLAVNGWLTPFSEKPNVRLHATMRSYALPRSIRMRPNISATEYARGKSQPR
jgi:hypothetical protein